MILMMITACGTVKQLPQDERPTISFTSEIGCEVPFEPVDLSILIAEATVLEGNEREEAIAIYSEEYTGWPARKMRVRKAKDNDIEYIYERTQRKNVFDLQLYSKEWGWLELDPGQEKKIANMYSMVSFLEHTQEVEGSQRYSR